MRFVKYSSVSSSAITLVWSQQPSMVMLIAKITFLICPPYSLDRSPYSHYGTCFQVVAAGAFRCGRRGLYHKVGRKNRAHLDRRTAGDALARFIHDCEDTKSLFCYKHVIETVFARAR